MKHDYLISGNENLLAHSYQFCVVIPVFNRSEYLKRCLESVRASQLPATLLIFFDDGSDDAETLQLLTKFRHPQADCLRIKRRNRLPQSGLLDTLHHNLMFAFNYALSHFECSYLAVLDSDTIVKKNWLLVLCSLYEKQTDKPNMILSGFTSLSSLRKKILKETADYYQVNLLNGVGLFFSVAFYTKIFVPMEPYWDDCLSRRMSERGYRMLASRPSVVQHIGKRGTFSGGYFFSERAVDFGPFPRINRFLYCATDFPIRFIRGKLGRIKRQFLGN